jgi:cytochrome o ubiquinol oxidase subunit IV
MSDLDHAGKSHHPDMPPGYEGLEPHAEIHGVGVYLLGLALATLLTAVSFFVARTTLVWQPSIPIALAVLAIAQMGVHLVFFLHITTGADNVNNIMALAFGVLIVMLIIIGSIWIMVHMNANMTPMGQSMSM